MINKVKQLYAKLNKTSFFVFEVIRSLLLTKRRMKILFSDRKKEMDHWKREIMLGFRFTQHEIAFKELSPENIKNYDLVVPSCIHDLKYLSGLRKMVADNPIPIPSIESLELCDDKYLFNRTLIEKDFSDYIPKIDGILAYSYILKKRIDNWGKNSHLITNAQQERVFNEIINNPEYYRQEFIPGLFEYATHILFKDGEIVHSTNIKYAFNTEFPVKGKDKPFYTRICHCPYLGLFSSILNSIDFNGLCCVNYKVVDNHPYILEINPRIGGSLYRYFFSYIRHIE